MFNLPGSRKNNGQKTIMKKLIKKTKHLTLIDNENFGKILSSFQIFFENESKSSVKNINLNHCIRQLLSALKSLKFISKPTENNIEINSMVIKCWNYLRKIYCDDDIFPETAILSAFCTPFILINFLMIKLSNINHDQIFRISFVLYTHLFAQSIEDENEFNDKVQNIIKNNPIVIVEDIQKQIDRIATKTNPFCQATFYYGILNCVSFFNILISDAIEIFDQIFNHLIRLCRIESKNTFQIYRLLNQYLKLLVDHQCMIEMEISNNNNISKYFVTNILEKTLSIVDSEWESPINGAITLMKENYQFLIKFIIQTRLEEENFIQQILTEQLESASQLPFTSKAKYKKLAVLTENLSLQTKNIQFKLLPGLPFKMDSMFSYKVIKHLSITAITTSIADYYKSSIFWIVSSAQTEDDQEKIEYIQEKWSQLWLIPITQIFKTDQIQFMIVHNILMASILPSTLQHIPESMNLMMTKLSDCPYGQVCLIRIYLEKYSQISTLSSTYQLPSIKWLITILINCDDMIRVEGLALLCDEKLIRKNRPLVCDIILRFLRNNLNVDNCSFRQRMIRVLERFFYKIITCLCDRYGGSQSQPINEEHKNLISFISNTLKLLAISLLPGSSFQRKFTALNLIAAIITLIKNGNYHLTIRRLLTNNDHNQQIEPIPIRFMLLYGIIDKDDKIRRLTNEILNQYSKTSLVSLGQDDAYKLFSNNWIERLYIHYSRSFRHQECHIGGLLCKYLINIDPIENIHHIFKLVNDSIELFYSDSFRKHMLQSSQSNPLHGWLLTLNQCLDFDNLAHHLFETKSTGEKGSTVIRTKIVEPIINLCFDVLEYFLELLTPKNDLDIEYDEDDDDENFSSPSFLEMSESIKQIIQKDKDFENYKDFTSTNEFQLILSMCWLNMKESCFLIANLSTLSADLLCCLINRTDYDDIRDFLLLSAEKLCQSVNRMANLMQRCRHRGVIEACSISLTKFTRSFLRIHFYLHQILDSDSPILHEYRLAIKNFVEEILAVITRHKTQLKTSVTRRSAGLALIIQSVLIGEAESFQKDKTKLSDGNGCQKTLYDQFIDILINISQSPIDNNDADEKTDLQQANAMHVLRSILGTSVLSQMNYKTAEILFPICLNGFISPYWQIRNASLQLFGACITRLLGQKKRTKSKPIADDHNDNGDDENDNGDNNDGEIEESTITMNEFYSRYPNLLKLICQHLQQSSSSSYEDHRPEIVPVLALTASFTSFAQFDESKQLIEVKNCLKNSFIQYIECNRCWKIRMLAAKSLTNLSTLSEMNEFLTNSLNNSTITSNHYHGLLYCAKYMIEQKSNFESNNNNNEIECYRQTLCKRFEQYSHTIKAFYILRPLFQSIFHKKIENLNNFTDENESIETTNDNIRLDRENDLQWIFERTSFKNADNIRLLAAKQMNEWLRKNHNNNKHDVQTLILIAQILLALFEDEDRTVRFESLKIGEILFKNHQIISTNITIDMFIDYWLIEKNPNGYRALFKLILKRFEQSLLFIENVEQMNDILFEKEEKNVFAEPYLINIRLLNSFINHSNLIQEIINEEYDRNEFEKLTQRFYKQLKINDHYKSYRNDIMFKGIWRLPKYFLFVINHLLFLRLALLIEPDNLDHQKQTSLIIDNNPFYLQELCKEFNTIKMDLIHFEF